MRKFSSSSRNSFFSIMPSLFPLRWIKTYSLEKETTSAFIFWPGSSLFWLGRDCSKRASKLALSLVLFVSFIQWEYEKIEFRSSEQKTRSLFPTNRLCLTCFFLDYRLEYKNIFYILVKNIRTVLLCKTCQRLVASRHPWRESMFLEWRIRYGTKIQHNRAHRSCGDGQKSRFQYGG